MASNEEISQSRDPQNPNEASYLGDQSCSPTPAWASRRPKRPPRWPVDDGGGGGGGVGGGGGDANDADDGDDDVIDAADDVAAARVLAPPEPAPKKTNQSCQSGIKATR